MNIQLWNKCVDFHGHECPGLAIGYKVCEMASERMDLQFSFDEELVCVTENDTCAVDAVQYITGCTLGKGNLVYRDTGKLAFSFFSRRTGESIRLILKSLKDGMTKDERKKYILEAPFEEIFDIKKPSFEIPEKAEIFDTIICENCHEGVPEHKIRINKGKKLCSDCAKHYSRGW
jgi:formylmethanofuran dehydrogenase subunit E